jgi:hypothetical protein
MRQKCRADDVALNTIRHFMMPTFGAKFAHDALKPNHFAV